MKNIKIDTSLSSIPSHVSFLGLDTPPRSPNVEKSELRLQDQIPARLLATLEPFSPACSESAAEPAFEVIPSQNLNSTTIAAEIMLDDAPRVAVLGIGYVGTHLVESFSEVYPVLGFDVSQKHVDQLRAEAFGAENGVELTTRREDLRAATHFLISVPTLLRDDKSVNDSYLRSALDIVCQSGRPGATIVVESSVAVGMTRQLLWPICEERRFFGGISPERVDPGRTDPPMRAIPKIISGLTPASLAAIARLYTPVFDTVVPVSAPEVAEMTKPYESCQRMMCIAYANEMTDACIPLGIDPFEVARAAASKPFGYLPFTPSAGVGGHCIPVNPYYLLSTCNFPLLGVAADRMGARPAALAQRTIDSLRRKRNVLAGGRNTRVLVVGVGFKAGQSASGDIDVMFADKLVSQAVVPAVPRLADEDWNAQHLSQFDKIIVVVRQTGMDFGVLGGLSVEIETWSQN